MGNTSSDTQQISRVTLATFDASKYEGVWYEVAAIPQSFEGSCQEAVSFYILLSGKLDITNYCINNNQVVNIIRAHATQLSKDAPGKFKINFEGFNLRGEAQYWVYDTDYKTYAIVGGGNADALWLLSRTKKMSPTLLVQLLVKAEKLGYQRHRIIIHPLALSS